MWLHGNIDDRVGHMGHAVNFINQITFDTQVHSDYKTSPAQEFIQ